MPLRRRPCRQSHVDKCRAEAEMQKEHAEANLGQRPSAFAFGRFRAPAPSLLPALSGGQMGAVGGQQHGRRRNISLVTENVFARRRGDQCALRTHCAIQHTRCDLVCLKRGGKFSIGHVRYRFLSVLLVRLILCDNIAASCFETAIFLAQVCVFFSQPARVPEVRST